MFLLYRKKYKTYPDQIEIDGRIYNINADFRNILRIFDMLDDENIPEIKKLDLLARWFCEDMPPENVSEAFLDFISVRQRRESDEVSEEEGEQQFCYSFDAKEIYAGFLSEYNIDLIDIDFLHWYKFKILLENLSPESAFKRKIELRFMDLSEAGTGRRFAELAEAKEAVRLPTRDIKIQEVQEIQEIEEFNKIWGKAGNN